MRVLLVIFTLLRPNLASDDPLLVAICQKSVAELKQVVASAAARGKSVDVPDDADHDKLASLLWEQAQGEVKDGGAKPWPGCNSISNAAKAAERLVSSTDSSRGKKMAEMLFKTQDKNRDGKLTRDELKDMIEKTNAAARAAGTPEADFFAGVDQDGDGAATPEEVQSYFDKELAKAKPAAAGSSSPNKKSKTGKSSAGTQAPGAAGMQEMMFKGLDKNGDGFLDETEMRRVIEQVNQQASNQKEGEKGEDFFKTLDRDGNGKIDKDEAKAFFASMEAMMGGGGSSGTTPKDEV